MAPKRKQPAPLTGFAVGSHTRRTKVLECDLEGFEGFRATVKRLSFADMNALPSLVSTYQETWDAMAPLVLEWNAQALTTDGNWEDVPPPAEAGPDAFLLIEPELSEWLFLKFKNLHIGSDEIAKKLMQLASTPETSDESNSD